MNNKRKTLHKLAGISLVATIMPSSWIKPTINAVLLPAHAQTSSGKTLKLLIDVGTVDEAGWHYLLSIENCEVGDLMTIGMRCFTGTVHPELFVGGSGGNLYSDSGSGSLCDGGHLPLIQDIPLINGSWSISVRPGPGTVEYRTGVIEIYMSPNCKISLLESTKNT